MIKITNAVGIDTVEILPKHTTTIGHECTHRLTGGLAGESSGALADIDIAGRIAEVLRVAGGAVAGIVEEGATHIVTVVGGIIESVIDSVPAHIFKKGKGDRSYDFLGAQVSSCHQLVVD